MRINFEKINTICIVAGYKGAIDFLIKFVLPVMGSVILISLLIGFIGDPIPGYMGILIFVIGAVFVFGYPLMEYNSIKQNINNHLHYFITYSGTISTMKINRLLFFRKISEKTIFGKISDVFQRILYMSKRWNLGYAPSCRIMVRRTPSAALADFLDRLAIVMDFGQDLEVFLYDEQKAVLDDYQVEYTKSLETIKMLQELFIAVTVSFSFLLGILLLAPLLLEVRVEDVLLFAILGLFVIDAGLIFAINSFIPKDRLAAEFDKKNLAQQKIRLYFFITLGISALLIPLLLIFTGLNVVVAIAIGLLPLAYPALLANQEEERINKRDKQFPVYSRVLGSAIQVRNGGVVSALQSTQSHDFGVLNDMSISLYRRLRLGSDKFKSWYLFAVDCGSNLIANFSKIFNESIYLGGNAEKVGEIVSKNMTRLLSLRKLRQQIAGGLRGAFYGSVIGLVSVVYISARVSQALIDLFSAPEDNQEIAEFIQGIVPDAVGVNFELVLIYIALLIIVQAITSAVIMKIVDGGLIYGALLDFIMLVWIGAALSLVLPPLVDTVLPDFSGIWDT